MSSLPATTSEPQHIILLVPGIRDFGGSWQETAKRILEVDSSVLVVGVRFGFYDVLSFAAPIDMTTGPYKKLLKAFTNVVEAYPSAKLSIVAHSFGTYLVGQMLVRNATVKIHRLLLCGAVIREDFAWEEVISRFSKDDSPVSKRIVNECGSDDIWPIVAKALSKRYGHAGRHGLEDDLHSTSVYYEGGHSLFFTEQHIRTSWKNYLICGVVPQANSPAPQATFFERVISLPFANLIFRLFSWLIWLLLYMWPLTLSIVAMGVYWDLGNGGVASRRIELPAFIGNIRQRATTLEDDAWKSYLSTLLERSQAKVNFVAAIVDVDVSAKATDGSRIMHLAATECGAIKTDAKTIEVVFPNNALPSDKDFSALLPSNGSYKIAEVEIELDNILWSAGDSNGRIFARGLKFRLQGTKEVSCNGN